ncbi:MAG: tetratricopeptide repeat protein [Kofleriaceae bacterium]|nr:MAG: tetratricopeptide repeat protein [Kofleriaceae bacterium]
MDAPPAPADAPSLLGDLPPLLLAEVDEATIKSSVALNNAGYAAHKKKDWATAEAKYREAVKADPGNLRARYNLACVYSSSDQAERAFAVLEQFKRPDCRACDAVLVKAKEDREWAARTQDPRFLAIVDGLTPAKTDMKQVTKLLITALRTGKTDGLEPYVHPRHPIAHSVLAYSPDQPPPDRYYGWSGFLKLVGKGDRSIEDNGVRSCTDSCCHTGGRGDSSYVVDKVCFSGTGDVLFISEIELDPGPI